MEEGEEEKEVRGSCCGKFRVDHLENGVECLSPFLWRAHLENITAERCKK